MWTVSKWIVWLWPYALIAIGAHRSRLFDLGWPVLMAASEESEFARFDILAPMLAEVRTSALPDADGSCGRSHQETELILLLGLL